MTEVWWVRRDARLSDNPALLRAQASGPAAAVFAWVPALHFWSGRRVAHLARVLWSLDQDTGGRLGIKRAPAADAVLAAAREHDAPVVWAAREFSPAGIVEQESVREALESDGRALRLEGSPYAVEPGTITKADGTEYKVFTPFRNAWRQHGWDAAAETADATAFVPTASDVGLDLYAAHGDTTDPVTPRREFREDRVLADAGAFIDSALGDYDATRDLPAADGTSNLSVPLAFGQIHPRTVLGWAAHDPSASARVFESEIAWRDFHADVLWNYPSARRESIKPVLSQDAWNTGKEADAAFVAWREGLTGYPLVDAGMRELAATGTMHNRVRMVVASFLIKDLHLPWQRGADYFRRTLLDYDHAQNQLNWQWVAGTGRDASPFFRVFNPTTQLQKFDAEREYVRRWLPDLDTPAYPAPIVDHAVERAVTLDTLRLSRP
ncbi:cryptochrome/photolyase family protein [Demequina aurantiaca]|uniref:cryptochrome/photolyase family protein n=1 Tax=Demequina aurantiaca TaxID=676200 RepID=UPI003D32AE7A